jgi:hypothetical protein
MFLRFFIIFATFVSVVRLFAVEERAEWQGKFTLANGVVVARNLGGIVAGPIPTKEYKFLKGSNVSFGRLTLQAREDGCLNLSMNPQAFYEELKKLGEISQIEPEALRMLLVVESVR